MGYTVSANAGTLEEKWYVVDAEGQVLGRLASDIAHVLRGKHDPRYTPHVNMKTHVIVVNAEKVSLSGDKMREKRYFWHTQWPGGIRSLSAQEMNDRKPGELVREAVQGMLPKNRLGRATMTRLRIFAGNEHTHHAQQPEPLPLRTPKK